MQSHSYKKVNPNGFSSYTTKQWDRMQQEENEPMQSA